MKVDDYKLIVALDETQSLKKAAERLYISQPAVSQRLKSIEREWGVPIFIRTKRTLFVTAEGEKIIELAHKVVLEEESVRNRLKTNGGTVEGNLSIGVSSIIGSTLLPKIVREFLQNYPKVNIKITVGSSPQIIADSKYYHLSIIRGSRLHNKTNECVIQDKHFLVIPKDRTPEDLPIIEFQADRSYLSELELFFENRFNKKYDPQIKVDQMSTCKELILEGVGISVLPEVALHDLDMSRFDIEEVKIANVPLIRETYIAYDDNMKQLPQVSAFIELLKSSMKK